VVILSKHPINLLGLHVMPTNMGRRFLMAELTLRTAAGTIKVRVGTVHLESLANAEVRSAQLNIIYPLLDNECENSFLMGDFNFCGNYCAVAVLMH
jgi:endonuclease/exonuclease/phosphatase family metal-dependent hydrolase